MNPSHYSQNVLQSGQSLQIYSWSCTFVWIDSLQYHSRAHPESKFLHLTLSFIKLRMQKSCWAFISSNFWKSGYLVKQFGHDSRTCLFKCDDIQLLQNINLQLLQNIVSLGKHKQIAHPKYWIKILTTSFSGSTYGIKIFDWVQLYTAKLLCFLQNYSFSCLSHKCCNTS